MKFVLRFLWLDNMIAVSLDQYIQGNYVPLTEFYCWPHVDSWEKMKMYLESETFISQAEVVGLLNLLTEVINLWQERYNVKHDFSSLSKRFPSANFMGL